MAGNVGETVSFGSDIDSADGYAAIEALLTTIDAGQVKVALVHDANPAYTLPKSSRFASTLSEGGYKVSTSMYLDETTALCDLILPQHHALERWDDLRPRAGVYNLMQPVMQPVFNTLPAGEVLLRTAKKAGGALARFTAASYQAHLESRWQALASQHGERDVAGFWHDALQRGGFFAPAPATQVSLASGGSQIKYTRPSFEGNGDLIFVAYPHGMLYDGRGANKPWLLENADPVTKITWHSWVELHPDLAERLDVRNGEILRLTSPHGTLEAPVYIYAGVHPNVVAMPLGFGPYRVRTIRSGSRSKCARSAGRAGRTISCPTSRPGLRSPRPASTSELATIEGTPRQLGRGIAESISLDAARKGLTIEQAYIAEGRGKHEVNTEQELEAVKGWSQEQAEATQYGDYAAANPRWGMTIDLAKCTGCQACVTACYAENNIPTVGESEIYKGREMTWMRIERYWEEEKAPGGRGHRAVYPDALPALHQRALRAGLPGLRGVSHRRRLERSGLQPLRGHPVLRQQLSLQGAVLQLVQVQRVGLAGAAAPAAESGRDGAGPRGHGEVHLLHSADPGSAEQRPAGGSAAPGRRIHHRLRPGLPIRRHCLRQSHDPASRVVACARIHRGYRVLEDLNTRPAITYLAKVTARTEA